MTINVGTGPGQYPPVVQYLSNGEPADDITFNRPLSDLDKRAETLRSAFDSLAIGDVTGLQAALQGAAPLHSNLIGITALDYGANVGKIFAIGLSGNPELIDNTLQGENNYGKNMGGGSGEVYQTKAGLELRFRTLKASTNISLNQTADEIEISSVPGEIRRLTKLCKNTTGATIPAFSLVSWLDDGTLGLSDANIQALSDLVGVTLSAIPDGQFGLVVRLGNVPGAVASLGATPGQPIYMSGTPGLMSLTPPTGLQDTIIMLGTAEPPDGVATGTTSDLYLQPSYVIEGGV